MVRLRPDAWLSRKSVLVTGGLRRLAVAAFCATFTATVALAADPAAETAADTDASFKQIVRPILAANCFGCHADGSSSGGIAFDELETAGKLLDNHDVWHKVLKNVRSGIMPPPDDATLSAEDRGKLVDWIKRQAFRLDPAKPDPGQVTLRRLNRTEYRNTVRDLIGVDYKVTEQFPPDDTGHGFDNIADVLTISPMLLEKYMAAADSVVREAVPLVSRAPAETVINGSAFASPGVPARPRGKSNALTLSYYEPANVEHRVTIPQAGTYKIVLNVMAEGRYAERAFDYNRVEARFGIDGVEVLQKDYGWTGKQEYPYTFEKKWSAGEHLLSLDVKPITDLPARPGEMKLSLVSVQLVGPLETEHWTKPKNHERYFGKADVPTDPAARRDLAGKILTNFANRAFRRPIDSGTTDRLTALAESVYTLPTQTFEAGVAHAMTAILASPRFLFLQEAIHPQDAAEPFPRIDEFSLASRLSYFLWSTKPDEELTRLAAAGELRKNLKAQVDRMLKDWRANAFFENFPGQWLQARDVEQVQIERRRVMDRQQLVKFLIQSDSDYNALRTAMKRETVDYFAHIVKENRSLVELIDSNYTFLNERLARHYEIEGVTGDQMRRVELPANSPRGGVLTMGTVLMVTSNPTRTSPVKRGLFLLENVLGSPPPPPPPDIPSLETVKKSMADKQPTLRQTLEQHRADPSCMSCHTRMDPPGLALENFNALGVWRDNEGAQPIDPTGQLITGEKFQDIRELKKILARDHRPEFYRCITEKLLTYAIGRGVEHYDVETVDQIVEALERDDGKFMTLLTRIVESAPFQRRRGDTQPAPGTPLAQAQQPYHQTP
ncbi:MAG TPA: DUF1592 domain-containing protein [Tepidisphaeraceae bacterium]|jgi:mono/diheme cytochrome c family protein